MPKGSAMKRPAASSLNPLVGPMAAAARAAVMKNHSRYGADRHRRAPMIVCAASVRSVAVGNDAIALPKPVINVLVSTTAHLMRGAHQADSGIVRVCRRHRQVNRGRGAYARVMFTATRPNPTGDYRRRPTGGITLSEHKAFAAVLV